MREKREKFFDNLENFWCLLKCGMRALFIGSKVDEIGS